MTALHSKIIKLLSDYLEKNPDQRFTQALFNLGINEFEETNTIVKRDVQPILRDVYNDEDEVVLERVTKGIRHITED